MLGIGPMEAIIIVALALIVLGPQKFPEAGRMLGKAMREFRSVTDDLTRDFKVPLDDPPPPRRRPTKTVSKYADTDFIVEHDTSAEVVEPDGSPELPQGDITVK